MDKKRVVLFGCGKFLERNIAWLKEKHDIICLCDNAPEKWGGNFCGYRCISPQELDRDEQVIVTVEDKCAEDGIFAQLRDMGIKAESIFVSSNNTKKIYCFNGELKHVYLYGTIQECRRLDVIISEACGDIVVDGYVDHVMRHIGLDSVSGKRVISLYLAEKMIREKIADGIIAIAYGYAFNEITRRNVSDDILGSEAFYIVNNKTFNKKRLLGDDVKNLFTSFGKTYRLGVLQFQICEKCNLNCSLCSHFAPLALKNDFYDYNQFTKDVSRVAKLLDEVDEIDLWGGEALLCPDLGRYIYEVRKHFPSSRRIVVGSNGLLVTKISDDLIEAMKKNRAMFSITCYPPTLDYVDQIKEFLDKKGIPVRFSRLTKVDRFYKRYDLSGMNNIKMSYKYCNEKFCPTVLNGNIAACYFPIVSHIFNEYFEEKFETTSDLLDLHDENLTKDKLIKFLRAPLDSCRYCGEMKMEEWSTSKRGTQMEDWVL